MNQDDSRQMKVLFFLHKTILLGGGTKSFLAMLRGLMQRGVQPIVVMPDSEGVYEVITGLDIPTVVVPYFDTVYPWVRSLKDVVLFLPRIIRHRTMNWIAIRRITRAVQSEGIHLVHSNVSINAVGYYVSRRLGVPHIYHVREYGDKDFSLYHFPSRRFFYRMLRAPQSYNICITRDIQRHFHQDGRAPSRVIYNGIQAVVETLPQRQKEDFFLYAGRLIETKGIRDLLMAYKAYFLRTNKPLQLYVMGEQPEQAYYQQLVNYVHEQQLEEYVKFLGERSDVQDYMQRARGCMPEAMFNGCLSIGRNTGGTREQMDNGLRLTGEEIALRYETQEQLTQWLLEVSEHDNDYYKPYQERAFNTVNQLYSIESNVRQVYDFYQLIMSKEGGQA